ncbi:MAG: restriction endonuclease subunit S [Clostridium sp.]|nr:restriction endonuclease subunit S [Clostridium sp.]
MKAQDLKNSVLQLAIQGKLVEQNPNDEPASVLLERIKAEKEQLIKEKKIKREKPLLEISEEEKPFEIPESWKWIRVGDLLYNMTGLSYKKDKLAIKTNEMVRVLRGGNILDMEYKFKDDDIFISSEFVKDNALLRNMDLITPAVTSLEHIGKIAFVDKDYNDVTAGGFVLILRNYYKCRELVKYLHYYFNSYYFRNECRRITNKSGQAFYNLSRPKLMNLVVAVPPLEEQKRIVAKIEEVLEKIEEYDKAEKELSELEKAFPQDMKKSILQYAVQGKLVGQNPNDEPASILLEKIKAEKEKLIKEKKIKREKPLPEISEEEKSFEIPDSWEWVRLGSILQKLTDGTHSTPRYVNEGIPFLSVKDMSSGILDFSNTKYISKQEHEELFKRCNPEYGDILLTKVGTTGVPVIVDTEKEFSLFVSVALLKFNKEFIYNKFLYYLLQSPLLKKQCEESTKGVGNKNLVIRDISKMILPFPPIEEQKRIVNKIEKIMIYIDKLQDKINSKDTINELVRIKSIEVEDKKELVSK